MNSNFNQNLFGGNIMQQQQPNFHKDQAAQYEQPTAGFQPRVQGKKFSYLKRKPAMQWHFQKRRSVVHSKIPLQQLRQKGNAIKDQPLLEKKRGVAWTVVLEDLLQRRGGIQQQKFRGAAIAGGNQPNFHGEQAAQFEQAPEGWKPRVSKKHSYLKRKPATKWHFKKHRSAHSKIPLDKLRRKGDGIANLPLVEKKNGIAWTVEIQELLVVDRRKIKEPMGQKLKRKAKEFAHAVAHPNDAYRHPGHDGRVVPLELQPAVAPVAVPAADKRLVHEERAIQRDHVPG